MKKMKKKRVREKTHTQKIDNEQGRSTTWLGCKKDIASLTFGKRERKKGRRYLGI